MTLIERLLAQANKEANELADLLNEAVEALEQPLREPQPLATGWLRDGALLYRLTDAARPINRCEIRVTMADGSRTPESCARMAGMILDLLTKPQASARKPMTDEEIYRHCPIWLSQEQCKTWVRQIEAAHGIKDKP